MQAKELKLAKEYWSIFNGVQQIIQWPDEVNIAMQELGPDWFLYILMGIASRESRFGLALDENGLGDQSHGHGIMQIDDSSHASFCASGLWRDLEQSLKYVIKSVIYPSYNYLANHFDLLGNDYGNLFWASIAAYNCGPGNVYRAINKGLHWDTYTTGYDYSVDVKYRAVELMEKLNEIG